MLNKIKILIVGAVISLSLFILPANATVPVSDNKMIQDTLVIIKKGEQMISIGNEIHKKTTEISDSIGKVYNDVNTIIGYGTAFVNEVTAGAKKIQNVATKISKIDKTVGNALDKSLNAVKRGDIAGAANIIEGAFIIAPGAALDEINKQRQAIDAYSLDNAALMASWADHCLSNLDPKKDTETVLNALGAAPDIVTVQKIQNERALGESVKKTSCELMLNALVSKNTAIQMMRNNPNTGLGMSSTATTE